MMKIKSTLIIAVTLATAAGLQAQGLITFANSGTTAVTNTSGAKAATSTPVWIGLFWTTSAAVAAAANPLTGVDGMELNSPAIGLSGFAGLFAGGQRSIANAGDTVYLQVRAWDKAFASDATGYRMALAQGSATQLYGYSPMMSGAIGGGSNPPSALTAAPFSFPGLALQFIPAIVPEPSILALGLLGGLGTLVLIRRRR